MALVPFIVPLGFAVLFGFVYQENVVNHIPMVVWDEDQSATSRSLIQAYTDADRFDFVAQVDTEEEMLDALHAGEARVALAIPRDFDKELKSGQGTDFMLMVDSSNNMFGNAAISASQEVSRSFSVAAGQQLLESQGLLPDDAIVAAYPVRMGAGDWQGPSWLLLVAKLVLYFALAMLSYLLVTVLVQYVFAIPLKALLGTLLGLASAFIVAAMSFGIFASAIFLPVHGSSNARAGGGKELRGGCICDRIGQRHRKSRKGWRIIMAMKHDTTQNPSKWSCALLALPAAALSLLAWQATALAAEPVAAAVSQTAENAGQVTQQEAGKAEAQQTQGLHVEPVKAAETESAKTPSTPAAAEPAAKKAEKRKNIEVQLEYLEGRFFAKRDVDLYNVHVYRQYKELGALSLHYGLTFERATGSTTEDDIWRDAEAVGFGPSYMMRWTKHISGKLDGSIDGSGSLLVYNHAHPGNGRAYGFLWRIGPRLTYHYTDRDALSLAYLFHHSSNGMSTHNPGYNGVGFSLGFTHWY